MPDPGIVDLLQDFSRPSYRPSDANVQPLTNLAIALPLMLGGSWWLKHRLQSIIHSMPKARRTDINQILSTAGLPKELPRAPFPGLDNAFYMEPGSHPPSGSKFQFSPSTLKRIQEHGLIGYDPEMVRPAIVAHEAGHASMRLNEPWWAPSRVNQSLLRPLGGILSFGAPMAASFVGAQTGNPLAGLGAGLALGGLTGLPTLINEWQASNRGKGYLRQLGEAPEDTQKSEKGLNRAYHTYLYSALAPAALAGLAAGGYGMYRKAVDGIGGHIPDYSALKAAT